MWVNVLLLDQDLSYTNTFPCNYPWSVLVEKKKKYVSCWFNNSCRSQDHLKCTLAIQVKACATGCLTSMNQHACDGLLMDPLCVSVASTHSLLLKSLRRYNTVTLTDILNLCCIFLRTLPPCPGACRCPERRWGRWLWPQTFWTWGTP